MPAQVQPLRRQDKACRGEEGSDIGPLARADFDDDLSESSNDTVGVRLSVPLFQGGLIRSRTRQQRALRSAW